MKLMMRKWCWIGLVLCATGPAWAAADGDEKSGSDTKKASAVDADSHDDATKDDTADEDEAPKPPPKKVAKKPKKAEAAKRSSSLDLGLLGSYGASPFTRLGIGLRGGLTLGNTEGLYIGVIGTIFTGTSVSDVRLNSPPAAESTRSTIVASGEVGYDVLASTDFLVRPYLSLGMAYKSDHTCATGVCWDDNGVRPALAPGLQAVYSMGTVYLGGDLRYQIILNTADASAAVISLTAGLRL